MSKPTQIIQQQTNNEQQQQILNHLEKIFTKILDGFENKLQKAKSRRF